MTVLTLQFPRLTRVPGGEADMTSQLHAHYDADVQRVEAAGGVEAPRVRLRLTPMFYQLQAKRQYTPWKGHGWSLELLPEQAERLMPALHEFIVGWVANELNTHGAR